MRAVVFNCGWLDTFLLARRTISARSAVTAVALTWSALAGLAVVRAGVIAGKAAGGVAGLGLYRLGALLRLARQVCRRVKGSCGRLRTRAAFTPTITSFAWRAAFSRAVLAGFAACVIPFGARFTARLATLCAFTPVRAIAATPAAFTAFAIAWCALATCFLACHVRLLAAGQCCRVGASGLGIGFATLALPLGWAITAVWAVAAIAASTASTASARFATALAARAIASFGAPTITGRAAFIGFVFLLGRFWRWAVCRCYRGRAEQVLDPAEEAFFGRGCGC